MTHEAPAPNLGAMKIIGGMLAGLVLAATAGCAGAGPGPDDAQPGTRESRFVDKAHDVAPALKDASDSHVVAIGRVFCKQAGVLRIDQGTTDYYIHGVSAETKKGAQAFTPTEIRSLIIESAALCPGKINPAMKYLR